MTIKLFIRCFIALGLLLIDLRAESKFYKFQAFDIESGETVTMAKFKDKVLLIVNVASQCGFTAGHYRELVDLQRSYESSKFNVLAFPCNQFGKQEPKKNKYIYKFATENYKVNFPIFSKIKVIGDHAHPIYKWLAEETLGTQPNWNFCKYLLNHKGDVVRYASASVSPLALQDDIKKLLAYEKLEGGQLYHELQYDDEYDEKHTEL